MGGGSSPSTKNTLTPAQQRISHQISPQITSGIQTGITPYTGNLVAPLDPMYSQLYSQLQSYNPTALNQQTQGALSNQLSEASSSGTLTQAATNNLYQNSILNPMMNSWNTQIKPQIQQAFAGGGRTFSSAAGNAQARELNTFNISGQGQLAQAVFGNQQLSANLNNDALNRQLAGIQAAPGVASMQLGQQSALQSLLSPFQTQAQNQANAQYQLFQQQQPQNNPWLQLGMGFLGQNQQALYQPQPSPFAQIGYGLAGSAAGALAGAGVNAGIGAIGGALGAGAASAGAGAAAGGGAASLAALAPLLLAL